MIEKSPIKDSGGPAFPLNNHGTLTFGLHVTGMTLRDYFAAKAMQSLVAGNSTDAQQIGRAAYIVADALLKARTA